jgi:hypothetical protein
MVRALNWGQHGKGMLPDSTHCLKGAEGVSQDPAVIAGNIYGMDETAVMLPALGFAKFPVSKLESE